MVFNQHDVEVVSPSSLVFPDLIGELYTKINLALKTLQFEPCFLQPVGLVSTTCRADLLGTRLVNLVSVSVPTALLLLSPAASACLFFSGGKNPLR